MKKLILLFLLCISTYANSQVYHRYYHLYPRDYHLYHRDYHSREKYCSPNWVFGTSLILTHGLENEKKLTPSFNFGIEIKDFIFEIGCTIEFYDYEKFIRTETNIIGKEIYIGPNGGHYYINNKGNKVYVSRDEYTSTYTYTNDIFNSYNISYQIYTFDLSYKLLKHKKCFIGPNIGFIYIDSELEKINIEDEDAFDGNIFNNTDKSSIIFGVIGGITLSDVVSVYSKITNRSIGVFINVNIVNH